MSEDIFKGRVSATSCISMNSALQITADITYNSWQKKWECDSAGFHTRQLVSRVGTTFVMSVMLAFLTVDFYLVIQG